MADRVTCAVEGCHRTMGHRQYVARFKHEPGFWVCTVHWALVPRWLRKHHARLKRLARKYGEDAVAPDLNRVWDRIWTRLR